MSAFYTTVARFYDAENSDKTDDLAMYSRLAAGAADGILDVGCGTGRVLLHLAKAGYSVHGIDKDRAMLDRLEQKLKASPQLRQRISFVYGDVMTHRWSREFGLILLSYNVLMQFQDLDEQITLLGNLRRFLAADGTLVIDLPNAGPAFASEDSDALNLERSFLDPETGHLIMLQSVSYLDRANQILSVEWIYDEIDGEGLVKRLMAPHRLRYFFLPELRLLLERCGFALKSVLGDTDGAPYDADSERMIVHAVGI
ncbi:MAG: class I SAM-dependent methyltransferase [Chloroflexi bacterium]|nr:class I SAM-dependent methyltransferase [Chloroflexota bacterium]